MDNTAIARQSASNLSQRVFMGAALSTIARLSLEAADALICDIEAFQKMFYKAYVAGNGAASVNPQVKGIYDQEIQDCINSIMIVRNKHVEAKARNNGKGGNTVDFPKKGGGK